MVRECRNLCMLVLMKEKLRADILKALHDKGYAYEFTALKEELQERFGHERVIEGHLDVFSSEVRHLLNVLSGEGLVHHQIGGTTGGHKSTFYSLTAEGYEIFQPWYKKVKRYFRHHIETVIVSALVYALMTFLLRQFGLSEI